MRSSFPYAVDWIQVRPNSAVKIAADATKAGRPRRISSSAAEYTYMQKVSNNLAMGVLEYWSDGLEELRVAGFELRAKN